MAHWNIIADINIGGTDGINHNKNLQNLSSLAIRSNAKSNSISRDIRTVILYTDYYELGTETTQPLEDKPFWSEDKNNERVLFYVPSFSITRV